MESKWKGDWKKDDGFCKKIFSLFFFLNKIWLFQIELNAEEKTPLIASHIKGTLAYLPPEFITQKILSTKLDVYSFGIVLLEIATGRFYESFYSPNIFIFEVF